ncbi:MAG: hypothetical protein OEZ52_11475 [Candidatus Aminicenantes bacterium]|nr:hypothetical protein [Candidatus Aminicenantes bacterium]
MKQDFRWNPFADQPHNVAPRRERFWHHFRYVPSYLSLVSANVQEAYPVLSLYRKYRRTMYKEQIKLEHCFGVSVSPLEGRNDGVLENLKDLGILQTLIRIPSWEKERLVFYQRFIEMVRARGFDVVLALLQRRKDVKNPEEWLHFLEDVFARFKSMCSFFEIGHAWNRTKWGVWDYKEYLKLAEPAVSLAQKYDIKLLGPAVIDFEFHLYPPILKKIFFDKVTSLLYVDRAGAPENKQFGWDTARKIVLLKAIVNGCLERNHDLWITEVNWPLEKTGKYSPAVGRANVSEEDQANYLVRYFVLCLASGHVERIYWWQLIAPGYGLIDSRPKDWRKRPGFFAFRSMVDRLEGSIFVEKIPHPDAHIFMFRKGEELVAVCWTPEASVVHMFHRRIQRVENRDGRELSFHENRIHIDPSPKYVYFF